MEFSQAAYDSLVARNLVLERQAKSNNITSNIDKLNSSQLISKIGSWDWDIKENKIEWSDMMYMLLGLIPTDETPSFALALSHIHIEDKSFYEDRLRLALENKEDYNFENRIIKKDKTIIDVISKGICFFDKNNNLIKMSGTVQDVTDYNELMNPSKQLKQFAHILSHDFKTPIRTIISFTDLIRKKSFTNLTEEGKEFFNFIESGAKNLSALVNNILEFSLLSTTVLKLEEISIKQITDDIVLGLDIKLKEKEGTIAIGSMAEIIFADKDRIQQVIQNLVSNAIKFTRPGIKPVIEIYCEESEKEFVFYVNDNGIGIEAEHLKKIFDPYISFEDEKSFSGSGLTMSISRRIIQLHKGKLQHSTIEEDGGSSFYFSIPKKV